MINAHDYVHYCTFCGKDHVQVDRLITGPESVFICSNCVFAIYSAGVQKAEVHGLQCSFCEKQQDEVASITPGAKSGAICNECIDLCQEILGATSV